ncbi:hypothetical protein C3L33_19681, partial [Rhododendron williamsianum]
MLLFPPPPPLSPLPRPLILAFSLFKTSTEAPPLSPHHQTNFDFKKASDGLCDYSDGKWIFDPTAGSDRYDQTCKEIFKGWNCIGSNKSNALDIVVSSSTGGVLESLGYKEGYRVDVDIPEGTWAEALSFHDVLIFNTGHWWWAPSKFNPVKSPMLFFEKGLPVMPPIPPAVGLDMVLKHMVGKLFSVDNNGTNVETRLVNQHLYKALDSSVFNVLDITRMSEFRADAHPSTAGGKKHDDCMHWCLPGVTDTWNDLFVARVVNIQGRN